ncbi:MAG: MarR family transcriptional regulator, partial [Alphaproteobacteria bacterium]|nr:MarR family transcriptional regulator [Alphaproteobacteria bacterium]
DRRSRDVTITPAGRAMVKAGRKAWQRAQKRFESEIGSSTAADMRRLLQQVAAADFV